MTITVTSVANTQSFGAWLSTTNRLVEIVSQNTVTVDTSTGGSLSTGNGYVNGYFGANYLYVANGLSGGNVSSNGVLDIVSNVAFKYSTSNLVTLTANSTESVLNINVTNVNITANTISITGNTSFSNAVNFSEAVTFANAVNMTSTSPSVFSSNVTVSGTVSVGNSTVNTTINSTAFGISNSTVSYSILAPTAAQYANNDYYLNANGQWALITPTSTGGSNTHVQFNDNGVFGGSAGLTFNKDSNTLTIGTSGVINSTGVYTTGTINAATISIGTSVVANTSRLVIGTAVGLQANGGIGTANQVLTSNGTTVYWNTPSAGVAGSDTQIQFNDAGALAGDTGLTFNKTTDTLSTNTILVTSTINAASHTVGTSTIANATGVYTTGTVNGASHTVGTSTIANATGVYTTGTVNGATISIGTSVIANTTRLVIGTAVGLQANGGIGTSGQVLTSNGTTVYWAGAGVAVTANNTDTQTFFIPMSNATTGTWSNGVVSNTKLYFVPSTGTLNATIFNSLSDREQKINIVTAPVGFIDLIRGVEYDWKNTGKKSSGVIAQEIEEYLPHLVETKDGSKSVNYSGLIAYLIEEIKQLKDRVKTLENK